MEWFSFKFDWWEDSSLLVDKCWYIWLWIVCLKIFIIVGKMDMGLKLLGLEIELFLWRGVIVVDFYDLGI